MKGVIGPANYVPARSEIDGYQYNVHCPNCDAIYLSGEYMLMSQDPVSKTKYALFYFKFATCSACGENGLLIPVLISGEEELQCFVEQFAFDSESKDSTYPFNWSYLELTETEITETEIINEVKVEKYVQVH